LSWRPGQHRGLLANRKALPTCGSCQPQITPDGTLMAGPDPRSDPDLAPLHVGGFSRRVFPFRHRRIVFGLVMIHLYRRFSAIEGALGRWMDMMMVEHVTVTDVRRLTIWML
jgi:hypothetical protein